MEGISTKIPYLRRHDANKLAETIATLRRKANNDLMAAQTGKIAQYKAYFELGGVFYEYVYHFQIKKGSGLRILYQGVEAIDDIDDWLDRILQWDTSALKSSAI